VRVADGDCARRAERSALDPSCASAIRLAGDEAPASARYGSGSATPTSTADRASPPIVEAATQESVRAGCARQRRTRQSQCCQDPARCAIAASAHAIAQSATRTLRSANDAAEQPRRSPVATLRACLPQPQGCRGCRVVNAPSIDLGECAVLTGARAPALTPHTGRCRCKGPPVPPTENVGTSNQWMTFYKEPPAWLISCGSCSGRRNSRAFGKLCRKSMLAEGGYERSSFPESRRKRTVAVLHRSPLIDETGEIVGALRRSGRFDRRLATSFRKSESVTESPGLCPYLWRLHDGRVSDLLTQLTKVLDGRLMNSREEDSLVLKRLRRRRSII